MPDLDLEIERFIKGIRERFWQFEDLKLEVIPTADLEFLIILADDSVGDEAQDKRFKEIKAKYSK